MTARGQVTCPEALLAGHAPKRGKNSKPYVARLGDDAQADDTLRHAHELNAQDSSTEEFLFQTTMRLAEKSQKQHQYSNAMRDFDEAAKLRPHALEPHPSMAEIYAREGKPTKAEEEQKQANRRSGK